MDYHVQSVTKCKMNEFLDLLHKEWSHLSPLKKLDPSAALDQVARMCRVLVDNGRHFAPKDETYTGCYTVSGMLESHGVSGRHRISLINYGVFDIWKVITEQASGKRLTDQEMDALFPIEFATNLKKDGDTVRLVSQKLLCFDASHKVPEYVMEYGNSRCYMPDMYILDFVWNILYLKLSTPKKLIEWVRSVRSSTYLLDDCNVQVLISQGRHEVYATTELDDTVSALKSITKVVDVVYSIIIENTRLLVENDMKSDDDEEIDIE